MIRDRLVGFLAVTLVAVTGCSKDKTQVSGTGTTASAAAAGDHAPKGAKPGSYEDWCGEHAVPESQCTLCHPELIAAFKASGDWCQEHSLPESHCLKCNPDLKIVRGPKTP